MVDASCTITNFDFWGSFLHRNCRIYFLIWCNAFPMAILRIENLGLASFSVSSTFGLFFVSCILLKNFRIWLINRVGYPFFSNMVEIILKSLRISE